ncbi:MAG: diguanylate cyclase, partial [Candidatus Aminicenantes bacterium]|nr:diguanylate cyclase [Candidatus Aminicenantes bacterium]
MSNVLILHIKDRLEASNFYSKTNLDEDAANYGGVDIVKEMVFVAIDTKKPVKDVFLITNWRKNRERRENGFPFLKLSKLGYGDIKDIARIITATVKISYSILTSIEEKYTDYLTNLPNRSFFNAEVKKTMANVLRHEGRTVSLVMLDIDHFKEVNDTYGHQSGDGVLQGIAEILKGAVREEDTAVRYGGEEFAVILPLTEIEKAREVAERIRKTVEETRIALDGGKIVKVTVSLGVSTFVNEGLTPYENETEIKRLIARADEALYDAKNTGRNKVAFKTAASSPIQSSSSCSGQPLIIEAMVEFFGGQIKGKRILEIGPGAETGCMKWLAKQGAEVWAVDSRIIGKGKKALFFLDASRRAGKIDGAECRIADMVEFLEGYLTIHSDKPFDAIYSRGAFEIGYITQKNRGEFPVEDQIRTLIEALEIMRKGTLNDRGALFIELFWPDRSLTAAVPKLVRNAGFNKVESTLDKLLILEKDLRASTNSLPHNTTSSPVREENDEKACRDLAEAIRRTPYPVSTYDVIGMAKLVANLHNIELSVLSQRCLALIKRNLYRTLPFSRLLPDAASRGVYNYLMPNLHKPEVFLLYWIHQLDSYIRVKLAGEKKEKDDGAIELHLRFEPRFDRPNTFAEILGTIGVKGKVAALKSSAEGIDIKIIFYNDRIKREVVEKLTMIREDAAYLGLKEKGKLQTRDMELSFLTFDEPGWLADVFTAISEVDKMINVNPGFEMGEEKDSLGEVEFVSITMQLEVPSNLKDVETRIKEALEDCAVGVKIAEISSGKKQTNSSPLVSSPATSKKSIDWQKVRLAIESILSKAFEKRHPISTGPTLFAVIKIVAERLGVDTSRSRRDKPLSKDLQAIEDIAYEVLEQIIFSKSNKNMPTSSPVGVRILVVDDEEVNRDLARAVLEIKGYEVEEAVNGRDALEKFKAGKFDLVVTDHHMPEMLGGDLVEELIKINPALPIIFMS